MLFVLSLGIGLVCGSVILGMVLLINHLTRPTKTNLEGPISSWN